MTSTHAKIYFYPDLFHSCSYSATQQLLFHSFSKLTNKLFHSYLFLNSAIVIPQLWNKFEMLLFLVRNKVIPQLSNTPLKSRVSRWSVYWDQDRNRLIIPFCHLRGPGQILSIDRIFAPSLNWQRNNMGNRNRLNHFIVQMEEFTKAETRGCPVHFNTLGQMSISPSHDSALNSRV